MGVGQRIVARRKELNLSQYALAKKAGISQSGLSTIESERNGATAATLQSIATALECSVTYLVDGIEKQPIANGDGLRSTVVDMLIDLPPADLQLVSDFVSWLKVIRTEDATQQG